MDKKLDKLGYTIKEPEKSKSIVSPIEPEDEHFSSIISSGGYYGYYLEQGAGQNNEFNLIRVYREMSLMPEVDSAIDDIVNEAITSDRDEPPVLIDLSKLNVSDGLKQKIRQEFDYILTLLDFDDKSHQIFRRWYVDGRLFFHKIIDLANPFEGIKELRYIDPLKIKKVRCKKPSEIKNKEDILNFGEVEEFYVYKPTGFAQNVNSYNRSNSSIKLSKDAVTFVPSGAIDYNNNLTLSYLHKAIKACNQLQMLEDSVVIYRLCLVGDTRVSTPTGYSYIKDLNPGDNVYCFDNRTDSLVETKVTNKWLTGIKKTYTVKSKHHSVTGTDTHPILVRDLETDEVKYVPIKDLKPKKHCFVYIKPEENSQKTLIPAPRENFYKLIKNIEFPEYINEEFARLFGFLIGNEYFNKNEITFSSVKNEKYSNYIIDNSLEAETLKLLGFITDSRDRKIPEWVFTCSNSIKKAFIEGLIDVVGYYKDNVDGYFVKLQLCHKSFIEGVKEIWTSIGLCSSLIEHSSEPLIDDSWTIHLSEYELPRFERITSITQAEEAPVYDIEVEHEKHNFVANGIVVHNSRSPERRIFYIDVGNLPTPKAEQYMKEIMSRYRTKIQYDVKTGYIKDGTKHMSMLEDFFIPRKDGKNTEITTLPPGQNLGELEDLKYFQKKLYQALNVPPSRLESDNTFNIGRGSEISRDELKFAKFIGRLRKKFSYLFLDILKSQLILKRIIRIEDWEFIKEFIQFDFIFDNHFNELKDIEILNERINAVGSLDPYVGKYFSHQYLMSKILKLSDREQEEIQSQIAFEKENNLYLSKDEEEALRQQEMEMQQAELQAAQGQEGEQSQLPPGEQQTGDIKGGGATEKEGSNPMGQQPKGSDINSLFKAQFKGKY